MIQPYQCESTGTNYAPDERIFDQELFMYGNGEHEGAKTSTSTLLVAKTHFLARVDPLLIFVM